MKRVTANLLKQHWTKGKKLLIDDLFYSIQSEGPFAGKPAYFVRLFGCNLNCSFCDTPQTAKPNQWKIKSIVDRIKRHCKGNLVVITGGEPFLQNIVPLVNALLKESFVVQIETNGTLSISDMPFDNKALYIVVSPKTKKLNKEIQQYVLVYKYIIDKDNINPNDGLPVGLFRPENAHKIMVSPMFDSKKTQRNIEETVKISKHFGYHFTLQYHKYISIP